MIALELTVIEAEVLDAALEFVINNGNPVPENDQLWQGVRDQLHTRMTNDLVAVEPGAEIKKVIAYDGDGKVAFEIQRCTLPEQSEADHKWDLVTPNPSNHSVELDDDLAVAFTEAMDWWEEVADVT